MSSLADTLEAATEGVLGSFQDAPAIQELLQQAPNASVLQLALVRSICEATPQAAQDVKVLEEELRNSKIVERFLKRPSEETIEHAKSKKLRQKAPESSQKYSELIDVFVGPTKEVFKIHKSYLVKIPYFAKYLDGSFRESEGSVVNLPEEKPEVFQRVFDYLYTGHIPDRVLKNFTQFDKDPVSAEGLIVIETYILGDKLCMEEFANKVMDILRESYKEFGTCDKDMLLVMEKGNVQLKNLVLRVATSYITTDGWEVSMTIQPGIRDDFFRADIKNAEELAMVLANHDKDGNPAHEEDGCKWHVHVNTPKCSQKVEGNGI